LKKLLPFLFLAVLLLSCQVEPQIISKIGARNFYAINFFNNEPYTVQAELLAENDICSVWVQQNTLSTADAEAVASEYKNYIYNKMMDTFGYDNLSMNNLTFNTMRLADYLGNGDGKLCILLLDIQEDRSGGSYIAGYFNPGDLLTSSNSNRCDMLYISTYPFSSVNGKKEVYTTIAHEMQHLMNFVTSVARRYELKNGVRYVSPMDTWIDEGLSSAAEWLYTGKQVEERIKWYNTEYANSRISEGNNFFKWGNVVNNSVEILDDYSTVYLFFQWLRLQSAGPGNNGIGIYKDIIYSEHIDYIAVTNAVSSKITGMTDWETLLKTWLAANYLNNANGIYGYRNEINIQKHSITNASQTVPLYPGEGVYSLVGSTSLTIPGKSGHIRYAGLLDVGSMVESGSFKNGALLTFNSNVSQDGAAENGTITGHISPSIAGARMVWQQPFTGPYAIGAGDLSGKRTFNRDVNDQNGRFVIIE
jgi:hypothetical protein